MNLLSSLLKYTADQIAALRAKDSSQDTTVSGIDTRLGTAETKITSVEAQLATAISAVTVDSEVQNVRVGASGATFTTAGGAVRTQAKDLSEFGAINICPIQSGSNTSGGITFVGDGEGGYTVTGTSTGNVHFSMYNNASQLPSGISAGDTVLVYLKNVNPKIRFYFNPYINGTKYDGQYCTGGYWYFKIPDNASGLEIRLSAWGYGAVCNDYVVPYIFISKTRYEEERDKASLNEQIADIKSGLVYKYDAIDVTTAAGIYDKNNSKSTGSAEWIHSLITVKEGEKYEISAYKYSSDYPAVLFRKNGTLLSYNSTPSSGKYSGLEVTVPSEANEMLINGNTDNSIHVAKWTVQETATKNEVVTKQYGAYIYDDQSVTLASGIVDTLGNITNVGQHTSISVSEGERYIGVVYVWGSTSYPIYLFRKAGAVVSYLNKTGTMYEFEVTVPSGVDEMIINTNNNYMILKKGSLVSSKPYSKWHGKKIAWFGTSIPETSTYNAVLGYPEYVGKLLGATVYNESRGSSCARRGFASKQSDNDPYGWTGMGWAAAIYNMGSTHAEKQTMLDNWDSKWKALVGGDHTLTEDDRTFAMYYSYETLLQQHITTPVDLYVFDHGYNDWSPDAVDMTMNPNDPFDRSTYQGVMNTFIKLILTANPRAKILLISHYETQERPTLVPMQEEVAKYWNLPFCKVCDSLGWANDRSVTSDGYWSNGTGNGIWITSGGTERSYSLKELHIPDGRHPNTDISGHACMDIAEIIADFINTITPTN